MKIVAYARASTEDQEITLADQQEKFRQYARLYDHRLVEMVVGSESAGTLKRDEFQRVLQLLRDGKADGLLVLNVDRLCRNVADGQELLRLYFGEDSTYGKHLFSVQDYIDTRTATGRMIFNFKLVVAQWERETIAERTKAALTYKRKNGHRVGEVRYGYRLHGNGKSLVALKSEQRGIALMKRLRRSGLSFAAIARRLDEAGFRTKHGRPWHANSVMRILARSE